MKIQLVLLLSTLLLLPTIMALVVVEKTFEERLTDYSKTVPYIPHRNTEESLLECERFVTRLCRDKMYRNVDHFNSCCAVEYQFCLERKTRISDGLPCENTLVPVVFCYTPDNCFTCYVETILCTHV
uniref:Cnidarian restricted protein n=1 Tax=Clytia hemisphaerica TaxID=252671 RepID=A0A7M5U0I3_9CNID